MVATAKKKLLVLDVNGLLLDTYFKNEKRPNCCPADGKVNKHHVYRRPYCNEFIEFCFENFEMGIWSSSKQHNVDGFINFIFGDLKNKLLFSWHQVDCTDTGLKAPGNRYKPVFLKELSKLWNKVKPDLPWEKGDYGPFNTLLIDDSPYKALRNPPYTAVFPDPYKVSNNFDDSLGGALRKYLEGLASASNVQHYVKHHPFGQKPISKESPHWSFYRKILLPIGDSAPYKEEVENDMVNAAIPNLEKSISFENREAGLHPGNRQYSESSTCIGKRKRKHRDCTVASTDQSSGLGMEENNGVVNEALPNIEKSISLENPKVNLQSGNGQLSESSSRSGKRKRKHRDHPVASTDQSSGLGMEENNGVVNVALPNIEKSISLENPKVNLQSGNGQQSESSSRSGKRKRKHRDRPVASTDQSSGLGMEENNGVVNVALPNIEKSISLENPKVNLQSGNGRQSESSSRIDKQKKRNRDCLRSSTNQSSVPGMEEENGVVNMAVLKMEKSTSSEDRKLNLQSGNGQQSESSLRSGKQRKRHKKRRGTSTNQSSVSGMEEENSVANVAMLTMEKSISSENIKVNLQSGNGQQSESSSQSGKQKKRHRDCLGTSTNQSSVPGMEEKNSVVNVAMLNMEKSISLENRKVNLQSGNGQQSESSLSIGKRKKRQRDCEFNGTTVPSFRQAHELCDVPFKNKAMASQTDKDHCNKPFTKRGSKSLDHNGFRYGNKGHHYKPAHFSPDSHMNSNRRSSSHSQRNSHGDSQASYFPGRQFQPDSHMNSNRWSSSHSQRNSHGDSQASYFPGRQCQADWGHKDGVDPSIHTNVAEGGVYTRNNMYSRNAVNTNFPPHQLEGYINDGQDRWLMHDGFHSQHPPPCQSYIPSHIGYPVCESYNPNQGTTEIRGPVMQHQFPNSQSHGQMPKTHYSTHYQGHGRNFHHFKKNSRSKHGGHR